jgi:hypothetical protein
MDFLSFMGKSFAKILINPIKSFYIFLAIFVLIVLFWLYRKGKWKRKYKQLRKEITFDPKELQSQLIQAYTNGDHNKKADIYATLKQSHQDISALKQKLDMVETANKLVDYQRSKPHSIE